MSDDLADRLERHVRIRMPGNSPVIENGAWQMMLDAAAEIRRLRVELQEAEDKVLNARLRDLS